MLNPTAPRNQYKAGNQFHHDSQTRLETLHIGAPETVPSDDFSSVDAGLLGTPSSWRGKGSERIPALCASLRLTDEEGFPHC